MTVNSNWRIVIRKEECRRESEFKRHFVSIDETWIHHMFSARWKSTNAPENITILVNIIWDSHWWCCICYIILLCVIGYISTKASLNYYVKGFSAQIIHQHLCDLWWHIVFTITDFEHGTSEKTRICLVPTEWESSNQVLT